MNVFFSETDALVEQAFGDVKDVVQQAINLESHMEDELTGLSELRQAIDDFSGEQFRGKFERNRLDELEQALAQLQEEQREGTEILQGLLNKQKKVSKVIDDNRDKIQQIQQRVSSAGRGGGGRQKNYN